MTTKAFLLAPCFNNYEIVASKVVEFYIQNSKTVDEVKTFFADTPFALYSMHMNPGNNILPCTTNTISNCIDKQTEMFIIILGLFTVCLARIDESVTININNGVVDIAGMGTLFGIANTLGKPTVIWNDDMRSTWGVSTDPLVLATNPTFYKNLYGVGMPQNESVFNKNMNDSSTPPVMGTNVSCPKGNIFSTMIPAALTNQNNSQDNNYGPPDTSSTYIGKLTQLGKKIINFVENSKGNNLGWNLINNPGLFYDLYFIISENTDLLSDVQRKFVQTALNNYNPWQTKDNQQLAPPSKMVLSTMNILQNTSKDFNNLLKGNTVPIVSYENLMSSNINARTASFIK